MISNFRNFAKTKFAGILVFIMIIPFVFWGMGGMFSSGNTNTVAKINKTNISTQEFIDYLNSSGIPENKIRDNLDNNIIEELLSNLVSTTLLDLEIKDYKLIISKNTLLKLIKENKNFLDEYGNFQRIKYEKFLLENNQSAPMFEQRLKKRELQKNLFDFIGAGTISPQFLINKLYEEENTKLDINFINLEPFYRKKNSFTNKELQIFVNENIDQLKVDYMDFKYAIINPKNLIGVDEFNQSFFDKIDQIEIDIANDISLEDILKDLNIPIKNKTNFKYSSKVNQIEKKIYQQRKNELDIFEDGDNYVIYDISKIEQREPDITDEDTRLELLELLSQKERFDYNRDILERINNKNFTNKDFEEMGQNLIQNIRINSIRDNNKFEINSIKILYSLSENSFTLINDEQNNIYLAKVDKFQKNSSDTKEDEIKKYTDKHNSNMKNSMLQSYDQYLNEKYKVVLNQKTIERVKNFFQ